MLLSAGNATAQAKPAAPPDETPAAATQLFDRGLKDMLEGRYDSGCPLLAKSYALEPLPGDPR